MFSPTKLLGGMMGGGVLGTAAKVAGVAAVGGVAYGAYRHYKAGGFGQGGPGLFGDKAPQPPGAAQQMAGANPFGGGGAAPGANPFGQPAGPPPQAGPPPGGNPWATQQPAGGNPWAQNQQAPPQPQPTDAAAEAPPLPTDSQEAQAMLLVRAMIAAAYIDGTLDDQERGKILQAAQNAGMGPAEQQALEQELGNPHKPYKLLGEVGDDPDMAKQFYMVTLLAIQCDTPNEQLYTQALPLILGLGPADVGQIRQQLGLA